MGRHSFFHIRAARPPFRRGMAVCVFLLSGACAGAQAVFPGGGLADLPDAPDVYLPAQTAAASSSTTAPTGTASVSGVIVDKSGAAVNRARITLLRDDGTTACSTTASLHGEWNCGKLAAATYRLQVQSGGFATYTSDPIPLASNQSVVLPNTLLAIAAADTNIDVTAYDPQVAIEQIHTEEKQRVLGVIPNFYIVYDPHPAPMTAKQKYQLAFRDTFDPVGFAGTAIGAEFEQINKNFAGYGYGVGGYAKRYAALYGDGMFDDVLSHAVFTALLHEDPRYYYQGTGTKMSRVKHAIAFAFVTRSDDGRTVPNYSYALGNLVSGGISNLYYPHADRGFGLVFAKVGIGIAGQAGGSLVEEFLSKYITTDAPDSKVPFGNEKK